VLDDKHVANAPALPASRSLRRTIRATALIYWWPRHRLPAIGEFEIELVNDTARRLANSPRFAPF